MVKDSNSLNKSLATLSKSNDKKVKALQHLGVVTLLDLFYYFPYRYEDYHASSIDELIDGQKAVIKGMVVTVPVLGRFGFKKTTLRFKLQVEGLVINVVFFNQPYLRDKILLNSEVSIYGKWEQLHLSLSANKLIPANQVGKLEPVYSVTASIKEWVLRKYIKEMFSKYQSELFEIVPKYWLEKWRLLPQKVMLQKIHFPNNYDDVKVARRTAVFEELFIYLAKLKWLKQKDDVKGIEVKYDVHLLRDFIQTLPFVLTDSQKQAVNEICRDLRSSIVMNRLLQGDVGSGKTIVAALAIYSTFTANEQSALMVPTEVLAIQHFVKLQELFKDTDLKVALLTSSTTKKQRKIILNELILGKIHLLIGTHALLQPDVIFQDLSFVVIDEQHRFGVDQRRSLRVKGQMPNILSMSATPIPRTLAITIYGNIKISTIKELPKGRLPIETIWLKTASDPILSQKIAQELNDGHQIYVVVPLIAESEKLDLQNAEAIYEQYLANYPQVKVGLLHGKMTPEEKSQILSDFTNNKLQILISTTVIEVGVDVKNATLMVIYDANRFGLAQLHQLRGRVGRNKLQSYCILLGNPKNEVAKKRLSLMVKSNDGFFLANNDLMIRGSGEVFGNRQSGEAVFKLADPLVDQKVLLAAKEAVEQIFKDDPELKDPSNAGLREILLAKNIQSDPLD